MESSDDDDDEGMFFNHQNKKKTEERSLRDVAEWACKKVYIGTAVLPQPLFTADVEDFDGNTNLQDVCNSIETTYARTIKREFNAVVVEHHLKWGPLCGELDNTTNNSTIELGRYDFTQADRIVDWCLQNDIVVKGHVLVWHVTSPKFLEDLPSHVVRQALQQHIFTVMNHYRDRILIWDVVNEALAPDGSLADTVFLRKLGPNYIEDCFRWAHEANPNATLLYNDNKVEGLTKKSDAFYSLLKDLKSRHVPVHGCGIQAHFTAAGTGRHRVPTPHQIKRNIRRLGQLGLSVNISEMDVRISKLDHEYQEMAQCQIYHDIIAAALSEPACDGIWLWGFTDRHTWVHSFYHEDEPCIFDENYLKKPSYYSVRDALLSLTPGYRVGGEGVLLDSDVDVNGHLWGHEWMLPDDTQEDENETTYSNDARPDWEQQEPVEDEIDEADRGVAALSDSNDDLDVVVVTKRNNDEEPLPEIS